MYTYDLNNDCKFMLTKYNMKIIYFQSHFSRMIYKVLSFKGTPLLIVVISGSVTRLNGYGTDQL